MLTTTSIVTLMYTAGTQHRANSTSLHEQSYHTSFFSSSVAINGVEFYNLRGLSPKQISFHPSGNNSSPELWKERNRS